MTLSGKLSKLSRISIMLMVGLASLLLAACTNVRVVQDSVEIVLPADEQATAEEEAPPTPEPFSPSTEVIASGLLSPRQLTYTSDGTLYIAEAGSGGTPSVVVDDENIVGGGLSSRISAVAPDGTQSVVLQGLPSIETRPGNTGYRGGQAIHVTDDSLWVGFGEGPSALFGLSHFYSVVQYDRESQRIGTIIDTAAAATANGQPAPEAVNSDPTDLAMADDGTLFIADAGCNCLWSWSEADGMQAFHLWDIDDNPVPTGVAIGPDGDVYVSTLSGFPFETGTARIERWSRDGDLVQTYGDLTLLTDVLVTDDGTIYAVQYASGFGDRGFIPDSGSVIIVSDDGATPVLEGLRTPYGLAQASDGSLVVSVVSVDDGSGSGGMVITVP